MYVFFDKEIMTQDGFEKYFLSLLFVSNHACFRELIKSKVSNKFRAGFSLKSYCKTLV